MKNCMRYIRTRTRASQLPTLVQEEAGIHVGISRDLDGAARHCADVMFKQYRSWRRRDRHAAWGQYKRRYFTIAVGGGNTVKAVYSAWLNEHHSDIDWLKHVRFFLLEETSGEPGREGVENSLVINFIVPLAHKLIKHKSKNVVARSLGLESPVDADDVIEAMIATMINPLRLGPVKAALERGQQRQARQLASAEARSCLLYTSDAADDSALV